MTQEEKKLLLVDLSARLPYGVICYWRIGSELTLNLTEYNGQLTCINKVEIENSSDYYYDCYFNVCNDFNGNSFQNEDVPIEIVKPYLRSMSSMTEEEKLYLKLNYGFELHGDVLSNLHIIKGGGYYEREGEYVEPTEDRQYTHITIDTVSELIKWLNAYHFDYRELIPTGLAIEVTEENNPYKK